MNYKKIRERGILRSIEHHVRPVLKPNYYFSCETKTMKSIEFVLIVVLQLISSVLSANYVCMGPEESIPITSVLCKKGRTNNELWQKVIDCHRPIDEDVCNYYNVHNMFTTFYFIENILVYAYNNSSKMWKTEIRSYCHKQIC